LKGTHPDQREFRANNIFFKILKKDEAGLKINKTETAKVAKILRKDRKGLTE
jgi:hypothetical protein